MNVQNKLPIALIATITILTGGGVLYLKIKPGPGKRLNVTKPDNTQEQTSLQKEESLTLAEKAVKTGYENKLRSGELYRIDVYKNLAYKEVENDGYKATVLIDGEYRIEDEWRTMRAVGFAELTGDVSKKKWDLDYFMHPKHTKAIRGWRDVQFLGMGAFKPLPPERYYNEKDCGEKGVTTKAEGKIEFENKGDEEHIIELLSLNARLSDPVGECSWKEKSKSIDALRGALKLNLPAHSKEIYKILLEQINNENCCVYSKVELETSEDSMLRTLSIDGEGRGDSVAGVQWFLQHPEYIP